MKHRLVIKDDFHHVDRKLDNDPPTSNRSGLLMSQEHRIKLLSPPPEQDLRILFSPEINPNFPDSMHRVLTAGNSNIRRVIKSNSRGHRMANSRSG